MITKILYTVHFDKDIISFLFSSKIAKTILLSKYPEFEKTFKSRQPFKNFVVSVLFRENKPLISSKNRKIVLKRNIPYRFYFTYIGEIPIEILKPWKCKIFEANAVIRPLYMKNEYIDKIRLRKSPYYKIDFITPTLLKIPGEKSSYYELYPNTYLVYHSIISHWNKYTSPELKIKINNIFEIWRKIRIIEQKIRVVKVTYDQKTFKAFIGNIIVKIDDSIIENISRIFAYANYIGIGKSRSIGFGQVNITPITIKH